MHNEHFTPGQDAPLEFDEPNTGESALLAAYAKTLPVTATA